MIVFTITRPDGDVETVKTSRTKLTVGGAYTNDIMLLNQDVSPEHGVFHITGEEVVYTDGGFGTFVNDRRIIDGSVAVSPEESIRIGGDTITFVWKREEAFPTTDLPSSQPDVTRTHPSPRPETTRPSPGMSRTSKTYPGQTLPVPESTPFRLSSILEKVSSRTSLPPGPTPVRPPYRYKRIETEKPDGQKVDIKTIANDFGEVIYLVILTIVFWPVGFFMTYSWWKASKDKTGDIAEKTAVFGCLQKLMVFNVCLLVIMILTIGILIVIKITR